ncbi:Protein H41C03.3 [Aphelenchoides avenae]|nr:Protein H41C03.3 [Aphelenchus avenae]
MTVKEGFELLPLIADDASDTEQRTDLPRQEVDRSATSALSKKPFFRKPKIVEHIDCGKLFDNVTYAHEVGRHRVPFTSNDDLPVDCGSIRSRNFFGVEPASREEAESSIAFAKIVHRDYLFQEMELAASYAPQNSYCYAIDEKSPPRFHAQMYSLAACLPNVYITRHEYSVDSAGHYMNYAFFECMKVLLEKSKNWKYLIFLQNHDVMLKTNEELVRIHKWFNGSNDVSSRALPGGRVDGSKNWTFEALNLFRNETRNRLPFNGSPPKLAFAKSIVETSVTRAMIDFIVNELNLTRLMHQIETSRYGIDEVIMGTLHTSDAVGAPGGFTHALSLWNGQSGCGSRRWRHGLCVYGVEDVGWLAGKAHLVGNKMMPEFDFAASVCWHEKMFNRTHYDKGTHRLRASVYENLPHTRFINEKKRNNGTVDLKTFDCSHNETV